MFFLWSVEKRPEIAIKENRIVLGEKLCVKHHYKKSVWINQPIVCFVSLLRCWNPGMARQSIKQYFIDLSLYRSVLVHFILFFFFSNYRLICFVYISGQVRVLLWTASKLHMFKLRYKTIFFHLVQLGLDPVPFGSSKSDWKSCETIPSYAPWADSSPWALEIPDNV